MTCASLSGVSARDKTRRSELNSEAAKRQPFRNLKGCKEEHTAKTVEKWGLGLRMDRIAAGTCLAKGHVSLGWVVPREFQQPPKPACFPPPGSVQLQEHLWTLYWDKLGDGLWAPGESQSCCLPLGYYFLGLSCHRD